MEAVVGGILTGCTGSSDVSIEAQIYRGSWCREGTALCSSNHVILLPLKIKLAQFARGGILYPSSSVAVMRLALVRKVEASEM